MKKMRYLLLISITFCWLKGNSQNYQATLKDSTTNEVIPYASIIYAPNNGLVSNEEGRFSIDLEKIKQDSIYISSVGYSKKSFSVGHLKDSVLYLNAAIENLDLVYLNKNNYTAKEIMKLVESNIDSNYRATTTNQKVFFRKSYITKIKQFDMEMVESSIPEIDEKLLDSIKDLIPRKSEYYNETLGNYYTDTESDKLIITKAAELYDKDQNLSMEGISSKLEQIFNDNVKRNSYLKIKSGIFGSKVQVDSIMADNEKSKEIKEKLESNDSIEKSKSSKRKIQNTKSNISNLNESLFFKDDPTLNIIDKINKYTFTINGYTLVNNEPCYIINFEPKGSKKFKGVLHVNVNDFAIVQMDYTNIKSLKDFSLLGFSYDENLYASKVFFRKKGNSYIPYYMQLDKGMTFGVKRPLTIIEKNKHVKGRNKQNEVALKMNIKIDQFERDEFLVYETSEINKEDFEKVIENKDFKSVYLPKYDSSFWAEENIVEPNSAIQNFSIQ